LRHARDFVLKLRVKKQNGTANVQKEDQPSKFLAKIIPFQGCIEPEMGKN
jgi:hypothetical protein